MTKSKDDSIFNSLEEAAYASRLIKSFFLSSEDKSEPACQSAMAKIAMEIEACIFNFCPVEKTEEEEKNTMTLITNIHRKNITPIEKSEKQNLETEKNDPKPEEEQDENNE